MANTGKTQHSTVGEREIKVTRTFNAPRHLVFDTYTKSEHVKRWLYGPEEWPLVECTIDPKPGGAIRYVWRHKDKGDMGMSGTFREVKPPERLVHTELFDQDWTGGETLVTTVFEERDGRTTVTTTVRYTSEPARDGAAKTGMIDGWSKALDRLDELLAGMSMPRARSV
jgi:uncharacterized protein YndB with AHSA1/START domain